MALFLLRALQIGLRFEDLNLLTVGEVGDIIVERMNDEYDYPKIATKEDFERF